MEMSKTGQIRLSNRYISKKDLELMGKESDN